LGRWLVVVWVAGVCPSLAIAQPEGPTIAFGGDVLYDAPLAYQIRRRARDVGREQAYREVFADLAPSLASADLAVVNLEVPITRRYRERTPEEDVPVFRAPEHFLDALRAAGIDALTIANNHAYDQGVRGLRNTVRAAAAREVPLIGVGDDPRDAASAEVVPVRGARIAIAAWTEASNHRPRGAEGEGARIAFLRDGTIADSLRDARRVAQLVIAVFHWGHEDLTRPRPMMREIAQLAAEAGADLVIGHGTHVPGSTEVVQTEDGRRVRVLYSLGNLLAAMEEPAGTLTAREVGVRDAPLAMIQTRWRDGRLEVSDVEVRHHWIARPIGAAPWLESGSLAVGRPVRLSLELDRLARAACGRRCDHRAQMYRRRIALIDRAMADLGEPPIVTGGLFASDAERARRRDEARQARVAELERRQAERARLREEAREARLAALAEREAERRRRRQARRAEQARLAALHAEQLREARAERARLAALRAERLREAREAQARLDALRTQRLEAERAAQLARLEERERRRAEAREARLAEQRAQQEERRRLLAARRAEAADVAERRARRDAERREARRAQLEAQEAERQRRLAAHRAERERLAARGTRGRAAASEPPASGGSTRVVVPDSDPRLRPYLSGVVFPIEFHEDAVAERSVDEGALGSVVALMLEDRGLDCVITGYSTEAEADVRASLGAMRARRMKVLIAGRGPSRSRFRTRGGDAGGGRRPGTGHVVIRLRRR